MNFLVGLTSVFQYIVSMLNNKTQLNKKVGYKYLTESFGI